MTTSAARVRTAILGQALNGRPVTADSLAEEAGMSAGAVASTLTSLHEAGAIYLRDGVVIAAYPFSLVPTGHRITIGGVTVYANCAVDALAVPPMVDEPAEIASLCGQCGAPVAITMHGDRVVGSRPAAPVIFYVEKDCCAAGPAVLTRCPHIQFFCGSDHAARWQEAHPDLRGTVFDLGAAATFARQHFSEANRATRNAG